MSSDRFSPVSTTAHSCRFLRKWRLAATVIAVIILPSKLFAQGPVISYTSGQTYTAGTPISPLVPVGSNVGAPGYAVSATAPIPAMNTVVSVTKDTRGNVYVVDQTNNVVKELPIGGGNPISFGGGFNMPMAVAIDASGNLFVADYNNNAVKEILASNGTTVSIGSGFVNPYNVTVDTTGNVYVADQSAAPYKKLTPVGGYYISTPLPAGLKLDPTTGIISGSPMATSPQTTYTIYAYNSSGSGSTTITITVAQPQAAPTISYNTPQVYPAGLPISPIVPTTTGLTNAVSTGTPVSASGGVGGNAIDIFLIMGQSNALGRGDITQSPQTVPGNITYFGGAIYPANDPLPTTYAVKKPYGSMWPAFGNTYNALTGRHVCFVQAARGGTSLVATGANYSNGVWDTNGVLAPNAAHQLQMAIDSLTLAGYAPVVKGFLWEQGEADAGAIANGVMTQLAYTDTLVTLANRFRAQFGATIPFYILRSGAIHPAPPDFMIWVRNAQEAALPLDSNMFIVTRNASTFNIRNMMSPDTILNLVHYSQSGYNELGVTAAQGVVLSQMSSATKQVFPASAAVVQTGAASNLPAGLATDAAGNLYYASPASTSIVKIPAGGGAPVNLGSGFSSPFGVAVDGAGNIYVADAGNNAIKKIPAGGGAPLTIVSGLNHPNGVAVDSQGNIFIADTYNNAIKELPAGGALITIGSGFSAPFGVAVDNNGNLYVADAGNNAIKKITLSTGVIQVIGSGFKKPTGVAVDNNGNIYIADEGNNAVKEIPLNSGGAVVLGQGYSSPFGIAVDTQGNVYVPNDANNGIKKISAASAYAITPALPGGLSFDTRTGIICGTTSVSSPATNYTVTASNSTGSQAATVNIQITGNITLKNLLFSNGLSLTPIFTPGTASYTIIAPNTVSATTVTPTTADNSSTVLVNGTPVTSGTASGTIALPFGTTVVTATVNAADGTSQTYTVNIIRNASANASLSGLTVSNGTLSPLFASGIANYTANVANGVTAITVTPTTAASAATITVNGVTGTSGSPSQSLPLAIGPNIITITITAQDGVTTQTYTLVVTRAASSNDNLSGLRPGSGSLSPAFSPSVTTYTESVTNTVTSITITPTSAVSTSLVTINGVPVNSGTASPPISLAFGPNTISVVVLAQDGVTTQTYTVTVNRVPSANASLSAFRISNGTLSPVFSTGTTNYTASVANGVSAMTVTPTISDPTASITVNGVAVASGSASQSLPLVVGPNTITTTVTAQDGVTIKTYTVVVTEAASTNANLSLLKPNSGNISPAFASGTTSYTETVNYAVSSITITPTTTFSGATVSVNGTAVVSGSASAPIPLNVGTNTIKTIVTAQDGVTTKTYTLTLTRSAALKNATLSALNLSTGTLSPSFVSATTGYNVSEPGDTYLVTVTPVTADVNASVTVNGVAVVSGTASQSIPLVVGNTTVTIVVTAQDVSSKKTYSVNINEPPSSNAYLANMVVSGGTLSPQFATATSSYADTVSYGTAINITPTTAVTTATVTVNGVAVTSGHASQNLPLVVGANTFAIVVTAQDGITKQTYTLTVVEKPSTNAALANLSTSTGSLNPSFTTNTNSYTVNIANGVNNIMVTPTVADPTASITVNGVSLASGTASQSIPLVVGSNSITVVVTAQDGVTQKTYTLTVIEAASSNAMLANLSAGAGSLSPSFNSNTNSYTVNVVNGVSAITLTPTVADLTASVTVNGASVPSGAASQTIPLVVGPNTITVVVTAQDGVTTKTYIVTVFEAPSSNAALANLSPGTGSLSPAFDTNTNSYTINVANGVNTIALTPTVADLTATVTVNGTPVVSGIASQSIPLFVGPNNIAVTVTAQDGVTTKTYNVTVIEAPSTNAALANLSFSDGSLSPSFDTNTSNYTINLTGVPAISITPTTADATATITINGTTVASGNPSGAIALSVGTNNITVIVTAQDGVTTQTYNITVFETASSNAALANLSPGTGSLSPSFDSNTNSYTVNVANGVNTITLTPITANAAAMVTVNGASVVSGSPSGAIALGVGANNVAVVVTAQDGVTIQTYNVTIVEAPSSNAALANLSPGAGSLTPQFSSNTNSYTVNVANGINTITLTPTVADPTATVTINGTSVASGSPSGAITLGVGANAVTVVVTAQDGVTTQTYNVTVIEAPSSNAALANLSPGTGSLSISFNSGITNYTINVANGVNTITFTPVVADPTASVTVNGIAVASGSPSPNLPLVVGPNNIAVVVTAQDGVTMQTYNVTVTQAASTNARLSALTLSNGTIRPAFTSGVTSYSTSVANTLTSMTVTPTTADPTATITVNGLATASGSPSAPVSLNVGANNITILVTAQDGVTTQAYTVTVTRAQSTNANLASYKISIGTLNPTFLSTTTSYTASVANGVSTMTVTPTTTDPTATITVNGVAVASGSPSGAIALSVGANNIVTVVTAQNGTTTKTYTLVVTEAASSNDNLSALKTGTGTISPAFSPSTTSYTESVANSVTSITVTPTTAVNTSTVKVNGTTVTSGTASAPVTLNVGQNTIAVLVTAQDGVTAQTYTINVTRAPSNNANLSAFKISRGTLAPVFAPGTLGYTASVVNGVTSLTVTPTTTDPTATISVNGTAVTPGNTSGAIALSVGANTINTVVTAQDGITTKTYALTVTRAASGSINKPELIVSQLAETPTPLDDGIVVHQALSPNGDGINDFLLIDNISRYPDNRLKIINIHGQTIYEATGYNNRSKVFDGHSNQTGQMQIPGTYFYQLDYTANGATKHKTGFLVLKY